MLFHYLNIVSFNAESRSFEFKLTKQRNAAIIATALYRIGYRVDSVGKEKEGEMELVLPEQFIDSLRLYVSLPEKISNPAFEIDPDEFQGIHEAIAHRILDLVVDRFTIRF